MTTTPSDTEEKGTDGGKRSGAGRRGQAVLIVAAVAAAFHLYGAGVAPFTALGALLVASALYLVSQNEALVARFGSPTVVDLVAGAVVVAAVLLLAWRATGWGLVAVASAALLHALAGPWLPGVLAEERDALAQVHGMVRQIDMASLLDAPVSLQAVTQAWVDANLAGGSR